MPREEMVVAGDDENIVGALLSQLTNRGGMSNVIQRARAGTLPGRTVSTPQFSAQLLANQVGGTQDNKLRAPLGLGSHVFTDNSPHAFIVEPQEAFRGERLIVDVVAAAGLLLSIDSIFVGSLPQTPSTEFGLPAVMFRADATDAGMDWQICPAGTKIIINAHAVGTFAEADEVVAQLGLYGVWIRG